jgi:plasmid stabilization system protein ParE
MTAKERIQQLINAQPDDASYEEILRELSFEQMVDRGLKDVREGKDNPRAASRTIQAIYDRAQVLKKFPQIGHKYRDESEGEIRILLYGHYRIAYLIHHSEAVDILGVFHTALDIDRYL